MKDAKLEVRVSCEIAEDSKRRERKRGLLGSVAEQRLVKTKLRRQHVSLIREVYELARLSGNE
jgi:hypothetical protein